MARARSGYGTRRKSRYCLFPLDKLGPEYRSPNSYADDDDELDEVDLEDLDPGQRAYYAMYERDSRPRTCGDPDTDMDGLCPLHAGLPYQHMTDQAWAYVRTALDHRLKAARAADAAWAAVHQIKQKKQTSKEDRWDDLVDRIRTGQRIPWSRVNVEFKQRLAQAPDLPEWVALELLDTIQPLDPDKLSPDAYEAYTDGYYVNLDPRLDIRVQLARNPGITEPVLRRLLSDDSPEVRRAAAERHAAPEDLTAQLLFDGATLAAVAHHRGTPGHVLKFLVDELTTPGSALSARLRTQEFRAQVNESLTWGASTLDASSVLWTIARHPNCPPETLDVISLLPGLSFQTLVSIAENPATSVETLRRLAETDTRKTVREAAAARLG